MVCDNGLDTWRYSCIFDALPPHGHVCCVYDDVCIYTFTFTPPAVTAALRLRCCSYGCSTHIVILRIAAFYTRLHLVCVCVHIPLRILPGLVVPVSLPNISPDL